MVEVRSGIPFSDLIMMKPLLSLSDIAVSRPTFAVRAVLYCGTVSTAMYRWTQHEVNMLGPGLKLLAQLNMWLNLSIKLSSD